MSDLIEFKPVELKSPVQLALRITEDNIDELAESLNGSVNEGILSFKISTHELFVIAGDWLVLFERGQDIVTYTDKMYQRLYKDI